MEVSNGAGHKPDSVPRKRRGNVYPCAREGGSFIWSGGHPPLRAAYPEAARATPWLPYLALLHAGFTKPSRLPEMLVGSYPTVSPLPAPIPKNRPLAVCSLLHFPSGRPAWELPSALPCGVRTFLDGTDPAAILSPAPFDAEILACFATRVFWHNSYSPRQAVGRDL